MVNLDRGCGKGSIQPIKARNNSTGDKARRTFLLPARSGNSTSIDRARLWAEYYPQRSLFWTMALKKEATLIPLESAEQWDEIVMAGPKLNSK